MWPDFGEKALHDAMKDQPSSSTFWWCIGEEIDEKDLQKQ